MVVAKSNRRKRQDRVKAGTKRAEQARRRAKAEREQQTAERYRCLLDREGKTCLIGANSKSKLNHDCKRDQP